MSITEQGLQGEKMARLILKNKFKVDGIFQADWLVIKDSKYYVVEVKHKEMFKSPPFNGQGLDIRQVKARMKFYAETGIRCLFLVINIPDNQGYWQWLDILEQTKYHDTRNKVKVYDIKNFAKFKNEYKN